MALCESQLDSALPSISREERDDSSDGQTPQPDAGGAGSGDGDAGDGGKVQPGEIFGGALPLSVDYRSPVSHFIPPAVELYASRNKPEPISTESSSSPTPAKRGRGRPRVDKSSPEYLAQAAARKQAREMAVMMNSSNESAEKRKRGRPRIDKTSPDYLARKRAKELEALEKKAKRQNKRRGTADSGASSSQDGAGAAGGRVKRKYTRRPPGSGPQPGRPRKDQSGSSGDRVKGKRGRPRKADLIAAGLLPGDGGSRSGLQPKIRVRSNLMPINSEPISLDSDDEPESQRHSASESISLDENLRALRHIHEKYANLSRDEQYNAQLLPAACKLRDERSSGGGGGGGGAGGTLEARVEKLEDSSGSDSDSSSSGSGSGSGSSSSSSTSGSSSSSTSSDSDSDEGGEGGQGGGATNGGDVTGAPHNSAGLLPHGDSLQVGGAADSDSDPERLPAPASPARSISESENESPDKSFQCHHCRKWYSTRVTLKIHRRVHLNRGGSGGRSRARSSDRYECDCCSATFSRRETLLHHKADAHRGSMTVRCEVCRKCFEDDAELAQHDATHTPDEREGRCSDCGSMFSRFDQLRRHRAAAHGHAAHAHTCPQCGKGFSHAHSLTRHLHNHARTAYKCVVCKASFARADQLAQHLNSHLANYKRLKPYGQQNK